MAVISGTLGDDERADTGPRDGRSVLWGDDILNGLNEDDRFDGDGDDDGPDGLPGAELPDAFLVASPHSLVLQNVGGAFVDTGQQLAGAAGSSPALREELRWRSATSTATATSTPSSLPVRRVTPCT